MTTFAHAGPHPSEPAAPVGPRDWTELAAAWPVEPFDWVPLLLSACLYACGVRRLWRAAGPGRGVRRWEAACFAGGWAVLAVALVSPLHPWGNARFSIHMTQHELLMLVAAPLLVLGKPVVAGLKALPRAWVGALLGLARPAWVGAVWRFATNPFAAWVLHLVVLWTWHVPLLFRAALQSEAVHALQHLSFLLSAVLFWWALLHPGHGRLRYGAALLYLFTTAVHSGLLGALMRLHVSNEDAATASVLDLASGKVGAVVNVQDEPEGVAFTPDGKFVYVTCEIKGEVCVIDAKTNKVVAEVAVGGRPRTVAFLPDGSKAFVPSETAGTIAIVDTQTYKVTDAIKLPDGSRPMGTAMSADGKRLFVGAGRAGTVCVLDPAAKKVLHTIAVGQRPWGLALTPDGKKLFVANGPSVDISVIDTATLKETGRVKAGKSPWGVAIVPAPE